MNYFDIGTEFALGPERLLPYIPQNVEVVTFDSFNVTNSLFETLEKTRQAVNGLSYAIDPFIQ